MDFGELLHAAKKNSADPNGVSKLYPLSSPLPLTHSLTNPMTSFQVRCYSTKFAPPKKESKDKNLSSGIKRFLAKKEEEEREKERKLRENRERLEALRDNKSKNKINKMLKVIKSADKSVISDPDSPEKKASSAALQPDEDDYGYVSQESSAFYKQLMEKYKTPEDDKNKTTTAHTTVNRSTTKRPPTSVSVAKSGSSSSSSKATSSTSANSRSSSHGSNGPRPVSTNKGSAANSKAPPTAIKRPNNRPPPPVVNFEALLKLAEQKQFEPIKVDASDKGARKDDRPMSAKEKKEHEERVRMAEDRKKRLNNENHDYRKSDPAASTSANDKGKRPEPPKRPNGPSIRPAATASTPAMGVNKPPRPSSSGTSNNNSPRNGQVGAAHTNKPKPSQEPVKTRQFPPPDVQRTRSFPPEDVPRRPPNNSARPFPPADVRRKGPGPAYGRDNKSECKFVFQLSNYS